VTDLVGGLLGGEGSGVLEPVTDLVGGLLGGGDTGGGLLAPVTGLLGGLLGGAAPVNLGDLLSQNDQSVV